MKMNEKQMETKQFIDKIIFEWDSSKNEVELQTINRSLKKFMNYSQPNEIDDLALFLAQGSDKSSKDSLIQVINSKLNYVKFDIGCDKRLKVRETIEKCIETFETAIELEEDSSNCFDLDGLNLALKNTDIKFNDEQYEYLIWIYFQQTKDVRKLKREQLLREENNASLSSIKEEKEESNLDKTSPKKHDESIDNKEKHEASEHDEYTGFDEQNENKNEAESDQEEMDDLPKTYSKLKTEKSVKIDDKEENKKPEDNIPNEESEEEEKHQNEEDELNDNDNDDEFDGNNQQDDQEVYHNQSVRDNLDEKEDQENNNEGDKANNDELTEQKMLEIAENAFSRISQEMLKRSFTPSIFYKPYTQIKTFEGEEVEVISTDDFLDSLMKLNINDFSEVDLKSLIKVLEKPQLDKCIQLQDLKEILENFGVREYQEQNKDNDANDGETNKNNDPRKRKK